MVDPTGEDGACIYSSGCTPQGPTIGEVLWKEAKDFVKHAINGTTGLPPTLSGGANVVVAPVRIANAVRLANAARAAEKVERAKFAAASFKAMAEKAGTTPAGVGKIVGWGAGRDAAAQAASRTGQINRATVAEMREAGLSKSLATSARDMYKAAMETGQKGGEVAAERFRLMEKILKNW